MKTKSTFTGECSYSENRRPSHFHVLTLIFTTIGERFVLLLLKDVPNFLRLKYGLNYTHVLMFQDRL